MATAEDVVRRTVGNRNRSRTGRPPQTLLQARRDNIGAPDIDWRRHAGQGRGGVDVQQGFIAAADLSQGRDGLGHGGGCVAVDCGHQTRPHPLHHVFDPTWIDHRAPFSLDQMQMRAAAVSDLAQ